MKDALVQMERGMHMIRDAAAGVSFYLYLPGDKPEMRPYENQCQKTLNLWDLLGTVISPPYFILFDLNSSCLKVSHGDPTLESRIALQSAKARFPASSLIAAAFTLSSDA